MKKFLACVLICSMSLGLTGCNLLKKTDSDKSDTKTEDKVKTSEKTTAKATAATTKKTTEKATQKATQTAGTPEEQISAYLKQAEDSGQIEKLVNSYAQKGIALEIIARGESMVYKCMFTQDIPENSSQIIENQVTAAAPSLKISAEEVKKDEPVIKTVVYEFYSKDNELLYTIDF